MNLSDKILVTQNGTKEETINFSIVYFFRRLDIVPNVLNTYPRELLRVLTVKFFKFLYRSIIVLVISD